MGIAVSLTSSVQTGVYVAKENSYSLIRVGDHIIPLDAIAFFRLAAAGDIEIHLRHREGAIVVPAGQAEVLREFLENFELKDLRARREAAGGYRPDYFA
jgi:hypothetical protein